MPSGMSSSPSTNTAGIATKTTRPAYGLSSSPASIAITSAMNTTAEAVVIDRAGNRERMARERCATSTRSTPYLRLAM